MIPPTHVLKRRRTFCFGKLKPAWFLAKRKEKTLGTKTTATTMPINNELIC